MNEEEKAEKNDETTSEEVAEKDVEAVNEDAEKTSDAKVTEVVDDVVKEAENKKTEEQQLVPKEIIVEPVVNIDTKPIVQEIANLTAKENTNEIIEVGEKKLVLEHQISSGDTLIIALLAANIIVTLLTSILAKR